MAKTTLLLLPLLLPACVIQSDAPTVTPAPFEFQSRDDGHGGRDRFLLNLHTAGGPQLEVRSEYQRTRPFLGLKLLELDKRAATRRGVQPFSGLLVTGVYPRSAAERAGVLAGDVLLALGDKPVVYLGQFAELESLLATDARVDLQLLRGQTPATLGVVVQALTEQVHDHDSVPLEPAPPQAFAGADLYAIPAVWCQRIYGSDRNAVVLAGVSVGGPAWLCGLRSGDVVDAVDGGPVPTAAALSQLLVERGKAGASVQLRVSRAPGDEYSAELQPRADPGTRGFWFPLVMHVRDGVYRDSWGVGPFAIVAGNRNEYIADAGTRQLQTRNVFSALLGLVRVQTEPDDTCVRLLWFIHLHV